MKAFLLPPFLAVAVLLLVATTAHADLVPEAKSAVLLDQVSGRVLFEKDADVPIPPASLTKLMTLHLVWKALAAHRVEASQLVPITPQTTGKAVPPGSSLMFLEPGQRVSVKELMLGLAVDSGNDAAMTLAQLLGGSQEGFVAQMNAEAAALGLTHTHFVDPHGYDAHNVTTARDYARFSRMYLAAHPQAVQVLHNVKEMTFPAEDNRAPGERRRPAITQQNRNTLIGTYPGADGLKTGYIDESGYNLAATALRSEQRLVAVLLGVQGRDAFEGGKLRTAAGSRLLDYGFTTYPLRALPLPEVPAIRAWYGSPSTVAAVPAGPTVYPLSTNEQSGIAVRVEGPHELRGPAPAGTVLGRLVWSRDGQDFYSINLKTAAAVTAAPWWQGLWDAVVLFFRGFTGTAAPQSAAARTQS